MDEPIRSAAPSIRMGQWQVAKESGTLRTLLGSCVGLALYDRKLRVGGLAHIVLPESRGKTDHPGKYVDTAVPKLIAEIKILVGSDTRLVARLAGGASMFTAATTTHIGQMNVQACQELLRMMKIPVLAMHCGGEQGRRMTLNIETGKVFVDIVGQSSIELA